MSYKALERVMIANLTITCLRGSMKEAPEAPAFAVNSSHEEPAVVRTESKAANADSPLLV